MNYIFPEWEYFGPWTDLEEAGEPISHLDMVSMAHDFEYARADNLGGHLGRTTKAQADFAAAGATDNYLVKSYLITQGLIRVFTFNELELPW
ncbi:MAG: capsid protein [Circular genetic element sp.]|nr:MAG: capsid protein [Circular genetic element sp.]